MTEDQRKRDGKYAKQRRKVKANRTHQGRVDADSLETKALTAVRASGNTGATYAELHIALHVGKTRILTVMAALEQVGLVRRGRAARPHRTTGHPVHWDAWFGQPPAPDYWAALQQARDITRTALEVEP